MSLRRAPKASSSHLVGRPENSTEWDRGVEGFVLKGDRAPKSRLMGFAAANLDRSSQRTGSHPAGGPPLGGAAELSLVRLATEKVEMTSV